MGRAIDSPPRVGLDRVRRFEPAPPWKALPEGVDARVVLDGLAGARRLLARRRLDLAAIDDALDRELHRAWTTPELAALVALSAPRFHARFAELTGRSPMAYVRQRRLDAAERLLRAGLTLDAAALQVGYAGASALAFALRRERGIGARSLRRP